MKRIDLLLPSQIFENGDNVAPDNPKSRNTLAATLHAKLLGLTWREWPSPAFGLEQEYDTVLWNNSIFPLFVNLSVLVTNTINSRLQGDLPLFSHVPLES